MKIEISYPVLPFVVTQPFGVNGEYYRKNGIPVKGHNGIDLRAYHGQAVYAVHSGLAYYTDDDGNEGDGVVIISDEKYEFEGKESHFKTIYWHLCDPHKEPQFTSPVFRYRIATKGKGMPVKKGDIIGYADNTGFSNGDHLHFSLKPVSKGESNGTWWNTKQNNGYGGAIDPMPFFEKETLSPIDQVSLLAAKKQSEGDSKTASILWAVVKLIRSFI